MISACKFCQFGCYDLIHVNCALVFSVGPILRIYVGVTMSADNVS